MVVVGIQNGFCISGSGGCVGDDAACGLPPSLISTEQNQVLVDVQREVIMYSHPGPIIHS